MRRIRYACLEETIHFLMKEEWADRTAAARAVQEEVALYKTQLEQSRKKYKILEQSLQPDQSVIMKVLKQYNNYDYGDYIQ